MKAKHYLMKLRNVTALAPDPTEDYMINIGLPIEASSSDSKDVANFLHKVLLDKHNTCMLVLHGKENNLHCARLSSQTHLEMPDSTRLGNLVLKRAASSKLQKEEERQQLRTRIDG